jgi:hypothetical protein
MPDPHPVPDIFSGPILGLTARSARLSTTKDPNVRAFASEHPGPEPMVAKPGILPPFSREFPHLLSGNLRPGSTQLGAKSAFLETLT